MREAFSSALRKADRGSRIAAATIRFFMTSLYPTRRTLLHYKIQGLFVFRNHMQRFLLALLVCSAPVWAAPSSTGELARAHAVLSRLPLHFEANQGQWNSEVRYAARSGGETLFLTAHGPVLANGSRRVDISLVHANRSAAIEPLDRLSTQTNYFVGDRGQWHRNVAEYQRIAYRSVYPGVDIVYYGNQNQLEYDFLLQPGADPRAIRWKFQGADRLQLTDEGDLVVESGGARFVQKRPVIYQQERPIGGHYTLLSRGMVGLRMDAYDHSRPLVVDPVLNYASFLGGGASDTITAMKIDADGRMYVAGYTYNSDLPANLYQAQNNGATDCFVAMVDPRFSGDRSLPSLTYLGGGRDDACTALALDAAGNIFVTGTTTSSDFPLVGNSVQTSLALSTTSSVFQPDAFVAEISVTDGLLYSTYFGGTGSETPHGIALDGSGNMYVIGTTDSSNLPVTGSAYAGVLYGPGDIFLVKLDPHATSPAYASYLGGEDREDGRGIAVGPNGLVYFAASTVSTQFPLAGVSYRSTLVGVENVIIGVMDMNKSGTDSLVYGTYFGGSVLEEVRKIVLDSRGRLLLTGWTLSPDFPTTATAMQASARGLGDAFVARVNPLAPPNSFLEYGTYLGGSDGDVAYDITTDSAGLIYVAGYTLSGDFPVTRDAVQSLFGLGIEAFVVKFDSAVAGPGALLYGSYFGSTGVHVANAVAVDRNGSIYLAGYTTPELQATESAYQTQFAGGYTDGFVMAVK